MVRNTSQADRPLSRILAGTDGSERATEAVRQGAGIAAAVGAELMLVCVNDSGRPDDSDVEKEAKGTLEVAIAVARSLNVEPDTRILSGDPGVAAIITPGSKLEKRLTESLGS